MAGAIAGWLGRKGYRYIRIDGKTYFAHRLAILYISNNFPVDQVDHIDTDKQNNKISNLRYANNGQNKMNSNKYKNNTSGFKGVNYHKRVCKFISRIQHGKNRISLGCFDTAEEAYAAYCAASKKFHKEFARTP